MDIARSGSGDGCYADLNVATLSVASSGSGDITLSGETGSASLNRVGSGDIDATHLKANTLKVNESGSGTTLR